VYLKVSPLRGMRRFKVKGKLSPRFNGPSESLGELGRWPTRLSYQIICLMYMMCSMCPAEEVSLCSRGTIANERA
jgi:hypothetical protein